MNEQRQLKTAKDLVELMDPIEKAKDLLNGSIKSMIGTLLHDDNEEVELFRKISIVTIDCIDKKEFYRKSEDIYSEIFSEEEIDEIYKFNQTDLGKKLSDNFPIINSKINQIVAEDIAKNEDKINKIIENFVMKDM